jgi:hypothetical protein
MRRLSRPELRFSLWFGLGRLSRALLRELLSADRTRREVALKLAADALLERFDGHEILAPDPVEPH